MDKESEVLKKLGETKKVISRNSIDTFAYEFHGHHLEEGVVIGAITRDEAPVHPSNVYFFTSTDYPDFFYPDNSYVKNEHWDEIKWLNHQIRTFSSRLKELIGTCEQLDLEAFLKRYEENKSE